MTPTVDLAVVRDFATALLIGVLIGIERERHKREHDDQTIGGIRTFILFALIGALGGWLTSALETPWVLVVAVLSATAAALAGYILSARRQPDALGLTTELAAIATCMLGALTMLGHRDLAVGLGVAVAAVLAYKQPLHGIVDKLGSDDIYAGLRLLIATFIVLPLLPDRAIDPLGAWNPASLWVLVLLISSLSLVGYVATRLLGAPRGIPLTGLTGGLVSSTAVTLSFSRQSREMRSAAASSALACGIMLAWCVMFGRVLVEVLVVNRTLLRPLLLPFGLMGAVAAGLAWYFYVASRRHSEPARSTEGVPLRNPFSLTSAAKFAAFFALVLLVVKLVQSYAPGKGIYFVAALAGTTDVDAITLSMAQYARTGDNQVAADAIAIAALTNTLIKGATVAVLGGGGLRGPVLTGTAAILLVGVTAIWLM